MAEFITLIETDDAGNETAEFIEIFAPLNRDEMERYMGGESPADIITDRDLESAFALSVETLEAQAA